MKGAHRITVQNKRIRYDFVIRRNITVIRGDSATGKTALVDMVQEHFENGEGSAVELICDKQCAVLEGRTWMGQLSEIEDSIVFIDEGNDFVMSDQFSAVIKKTDNYYVIVTREGIPSLPYSIEEIYGIRNSGKYGTLKRTYNELFPLYPQAEHPAVVNPNLVITEDSNSGYQFFYEICGREKAIACVSANGKSNIFSIVVKQMEKQILVIADGAAFGSEMDKMMELTQHHSNIKLYLPESFEWLILKSGIVGNGNQDVMLENPEDQIESRKYFSWERYFSALLIQITKDTHFKYVKKQLNPIYLQDRWAGKILAVMQGLDLTGEENLTGGHIHDQTKF